MQLVVLLAVLLTGLPAIAEINSATLIGEWCLVSQTMNGHDLAILPPKGILSENSWPSQGKDIIVLMKKPLSDDGG